MLFNRMDLRGFYFDKSNDQGAASDDSDEGDETEVSSPAQSALTSLISKTGDANKVALQLLEENYRYRQQLRDLRKNQIKAGQVIITEAEKVLFDQYKALGEPETIKQFVADLATLKRDEFIRTVADIHKFKPSVLGKLIVDEKIEVRQEVIDSKTVPYAVVLRDGQEPVRLDKYAEDKWSDFIPALQDITNQGVGGTSQGDKQSVTFPRQTRGTGPEHKDPVAERIAARQAALDKAKNPFQTQP